MQSTVKIYNFCFKLPIRSWYAVKKYTDKKESQM